MDVTESELHVMSLGLDSQIHLTGSVHESLWSEHGRGLNNDTWVRKENVGWTYHIVHIYYIYNGLVIVLLPYA